MSFPDLVITCAGNLAVFYSSILRGGLYLEMAAKDALTFLTGPKKVKNIKKEWDDISMGFGLTTCWDQEHLSDCSVIMLSEETPNSSMTQFVEYIANVYDLRSVLLPYLPLEHGALTQEICTCPLRKDDRSYDDSKCGCILFWTGVNEVITITLAEQIPGTLKALCPGLCLLPSLDCLKNGCHGCDQGLLHAEEKEDISLFEGIHEDICPLEETEANHFGTNKKTDLEESKANDFGTNKKGLRYGEPKVKHSAAVCGISYSSTFRLGGICIPVLQEGNHRGNDRWTELLIGCFKSNDYETRGDIIRREKSSISNDLENYMAGTGKCYAEEEYSIVSLILPRLTEILINLVLVFWFKVDGFSSSLIARRAVRNYIVNDSKRGFAAHVFMNAAEVRSNDDNTNVYQVLSFRGNVWNPRALSVIVGFVNLACSITWAVLVALEGGSNKWYHTHSMAPSKGRLLVIFVGIAIALSMDCVDLYLYLQNARWSIERRDNRRRKILIICTMIVLQISCIVSSSLVARAVGIKSFHRWVYGAVQVLVWLKWGIGSYLLGQYMPRERSRPPWTYGKTGMYMYASAFWLNAILAGARAKWEFF